MVEPIRGLGGQGESVYGASSRESAFARGGESQRDIATHTADHVAFPDAASLDDTTGPDRRLLIGALIGDSDDVDTLDSPLFSGTTEETPAEAADGPRPSVEPRGPDGLQRAMASKSRQRLEGSMLQAQGRPARGEYALRAESGPSASAPDLRLLAEGVIPSMMEGLLNQVHRSGKRNKKDAAKLLLIILKAHGAYVYEHCTRLVDLAQSLAREMGEKSENLDRQVEDGLIYRDVGEVGFFLTRRSARQREALAAYLGGDDMAQDAMLHDLGKIQVPEAILYKPGPLNAEERAIMQRHPVWGAQILESLPPLHHAIPVVRHHHERFDGQGYPDGLSGEDIPLAARIVSVVDAFDAMVSDRPYRRGLPLDEACRIIREGSGTQFDARVARAFLSIVDRVWSPDRHY